MDDAIRIVPAIDTDEAGGGLEEGVKGCDPEPPTIPAQELWTRLESFQSRPMFPRIWFSKSVA